MHAVARFVAALALAVGLVGLPVPASSAASAASDAAAGSGSPNLVPVAHLPLSGGGLADPGWGSDIEFATVDVTGLPGAPVTGRRTFALAGSLSRGLQIVDVTNPRRPRPAAVYDCRVSQGDVQVFRRAGRTYVTYAADYGVVLGSPCYDQLRELGVDVGSGLGSVIVDVTNPYRPTAVGFAAEPTGSHNMTVHPSGGFLYNSNSDFRLRGTIEVFDIRGRRLASPARLRPVQTGGSDSHDITFSADGTRAYSAALDSTVVLDTTDPARPRVVGRIVDPAIQIHHQADPVTVTDPELGTRTLLVVTDEVAGGGPAPCPGGGLHVYDVTGAREQAPVKLGAWFISDVDASDHERGCTAHVLRMHPDEGILTMAWYRKGVRVLDISGLASARPGQVETPIREIAWYAFADANTWAAKTPAIAADGSFHLFGNDIARGIDVYRFDPDAPQAADPGRWVPATPAAAAAAAAAPATATPTGQQFACVLRPPG